MCTNSSDLHTHHSHQTKYQHLIFSQYYQFSSSFHLMYHHMHIDRVKYGVTCSGCPHKHMNMFLLCSSWGNYINNKLHVLSNHEMPSHFSVY